MPARLLIPLTILLLAGCATDRSARAHSVRPLAAYFSEDDYPAAALRAHEAGTTAFRLTIAPDGRVSDCAITASSGSSSLDSTSCRLLTARARFEPARDRKGRPTTDSVIGRLTWQFPQDDGGDAPSEPQP
jgi:TonB family protein